MIITLVIFLKVELCCELLNYGKNEGKKLNCNVHRINSQSEVDKAEYQDEYLKNELSFVYWFFLLFFLNCLALLKIVLHSCLYINIDIIVMNIQAIENDENKLQYKSSKALKILEEYAEEPLGPKKKQFYLQLLKGQTKTLRVQESKGPNKIKQRMKFDLKSSPKNIITVSDTFLFDFLMIGVLESQALNIKLEPNKQKEQENGENDLVNEIDEKKQLDVIISGDEFDCKIQTQKFHQILEEKLKQGQKVSMTSFRIEFGEVPGSRSVGFKVKIIKILEQLVKFMADIELSALSTFQVASGRNWSTYFYPLLSKITTHSLKVSFNKQNININKIQMPLAHGDIYTTYHQQFSESSQNEEENKFYRVQELIVSGPISYINNERIKFYLENVMGLFPNLINLEFRDIIFIEKSFQILADSICISNSLLESLEVTRIQQSNDMVHSLKNILSKSPYLFDVSVPTVSKVPTVQSTQKKLIVLIAHKVVNIQRALTVAKILEKKNFTFDTCCNVMERYQNYGNI